MRRLLARVPPGSRAATVAGAALAASVVRLLARPEWGGAEHLPDGPAIYCPNHLSELDPFVVGHFLYSHGVAACFLAKASAFRVPVAGAWARRLGFIPVERAGGGHAALDLARRALDAGRPVVLYPEGTLTRDPALWPMRGRDGAAWLAFATGAPVVPLAHWGVQAVLPPYARRPRVPPRRAVRVLAGAPVSLGDLAARADRDRTAEATRRIQGATVALLAKLRGEREPESW